MNLANEIWKLSRDILLVLTGVFLVVGLVLGQVPPAIAPTLVPLAFGLFALPGWLRGDERKQRNRRERERGADDYDNGEGTDQDDLGA